jgi:hypothetical protein
MPTPRCNVLLKWVKQFLYSVARKIRIQTSFENFGQKNPTIPRFSGNRCFWFLPKKSESRKKNLALGKPCLYIMEEITLRYDPMRGALAAPKRRTPAFHGLNFCVKPTYASMYRHGLLHI